MNCVYTLFPAEDLRREWGVDLTALPDEWPAPLRDFVSAALSCGMFPSVADFTNMLDCAKHWGHMARYPESWNWLYGSPVVLVPARTSRGLTAIWLLWMLCLTPWKMRAGS